MAYIYQIINDINDKVYVGKTTLQSIEERFKEHCKDSSRPRYEKRPLYNAMQKYGVDKFHVSLLEEVEDISQLEDREIFWIDKKDSYRNGYNATRGGDGKMFIDRQKVLSLWSSGYLISEIAKTMHHNEDQIALILKTNGITQEEIYKRMALKKSIKIAQKDKNTGEIIQIFESMNEAARVMKESGYTNCMVSTGSSHISQVCNGKRKTFAGFIWTKI